MKKTMNGIAASGGYAYAKAYCLEYPPMDIQGQVFVSVEEEEQKLEKALKTSVEQLEVIKKTAQEKLGEEEAAVFDAHMLMVLDPDLKSQILSKINSEKITAAKAANNTIDELIFMFESMDNDYMKERAADLKDVRFRLLANILEEKIIDLSSIDEEVVIVAEDLTPSETSQLDKNYVLGFLTNIGGRTSHSAIMARSLEIPAIVGMSDVLETVKDGDMLLIDAFEGEVIINPSEEEVEEITVKKSKYEEEKKLWQQYKDKETISEDGFQVELMANIGTPNDLEAVIANGAEGIGLYRTEFLYMDSKDFPTEEVQFEAYKKVLEAMDNKAVVVRTLDIGGDKKLDYYEFPYEMNPFLGHRAIRLCLDKKEIFRTQLRALLRASAYGKLKIMFPMIATLTEFRQAKAILEEEKAKLLAENVNVSDEIEIGIMVEIPATAMMADTFAKEVDFFSIGTNDLIQYTMAADRMSENVSYLYQPFNPSILRMIKNVIDAANKEGKWAGMCGEMASSPYAIVILLALGLHEFSMSATSILAARYQISKLNKAELEKHIDTILGLTTDQEVEEYIKEKMFLDT